jgi:hypothetical protein
MRPEGQRVRNVGWCAWTKRRLISPRPLGRLGLGHLVHASTQVMKQLASWNPFAARLKRSTEATQSAPSCNNCQLESIALLDWNNWAETTGFPVSSCFVSSYFQLKCPDISTLEKHQRERVVRSLICRQREAIQPINPFAETACPRQSKCRLCDQPAPAQPPTRALRYPPPSRTTPLLGHAATWPRRCV